MSVLLFQWQDSIIKAVFSEIFLPQSQWGKQEQPKQHASGVREADMPESGSSGTSLLSDVADVYGLCLKPTQLPSQSSPPQLVYTSICCDHNTAFLTALSVSLAHILWFLTSGCLPLF